MCHHLQYMTSLRWLIVISLFFGPRWSTLVFRSAILVIEMVFSASFISNNIFSFSKVEGSHLHKK